VGFDVPGGNFTASDQMYRICGLEPRPGPEPLDMIRQLVHPSDVARFEAALADALAGQADDIDMDIRVVRPSGELRWVNTAAELSRDAQGTPISVIGTLLDITDRKRVEDSLRASEVRLQVFASAR
jgi:PAS domain-containing protein